jgi:hypothetical protein
MSRSEEFLAECACGRVAFVGRGKPIVVLACYCRDCQAAAEYVQSLPAGRSGMGSDGGTVSVLYPKQRVRNVRGAELLREYKLTPSSRTTRLISGCCACSLSARLGSWFPYAPLRTFFAGAEPIVPTLGIFTRYAPAPDAIVHAVPCYPTISAGLVLKLGAAKVSELILSPFVRMDWI